VTLQTVGLLRFQFFGVGSVRQIFCQGVSASFVLSKIWLACASITLANNSSCLRSWDSVRRNSCHISKQCL
jgi:hypothetical protein